MCVCVCACVRACVRVCVCVCVCGERERERSLCNKPVDTNKPGCVRMDDGPSGDHTIDARSFTVPIDCCYQCSCLIS